MPVLMLWFGPPVCIRETPMAPKLTYTGIRVKDLEKSVAFYSGLLGMKETGRSEIPESKGTAVQLVSASGGPVLELNHYADGTRFATKYSVGEALDHLAFHVDDLDKFLADARKAGSPTVLEMRSGTSRWAYVEDPNGIWIEAFA